MHEHSHSIPLASQQAGCAGFVCSERLDHVDAAELRKCTFDDVFEPTFRRFPPFVQPIPTWVGRCDDSPLARVGCPPHKVNVRAIAVSRQGGMRQESPSDTIFPAALDPDHSHVG